MSLKQLIQNEVNILLNFIKYCIENKEKLLAEQNLDEFVTKAKITMESISNLRWLISFTQQVIALHKFKQEPKLKKFYDETKETIKILIARYERMI